MTAKHVVEGNWWQRRSRRGKVGIFTLALLAIAGIAIAAIALINGFTGTVDPTVQAQYQVDLTTATLTSGDCLSAPAATSVANTTTDQWAFNWNPVVGTFNDVPPAAVDLPDCSVSLTYSNPSSTNFYFNGVTLPSGLVLVGNTNPEANFSAATKLGAGATKTITFTFRLDSASGTPFSFAPATHGVKWCHDNGTFVGCAP